MASLTAPAQSFEDRWSKFYAEAAFDEENAAASKTSPTTLSPKKGASASPSYAEFAAVATLAPTASSGHHQPPQQQQQDDEAANELEQWISDFDQRMDEKKDAMDKRAFRQLKADGDEIDRWHDYHQEQAAKLREQEAEEAERERQEVLRKEREEIDNAEKLYIERSTACLTPRSKQRWLEDNDEINALERQLHKHETKMEDLNGHIGTLVGEYEARLQKEAEEAERIAAEEERERQLFEDKLRGERAVVADEFAEVCMELFSAACEELWSGMQSSAEASRTLAAQVARDRVFKTLSEYDLGRVEAARGDDALYAELLDELVEVDVLRQKLKKQLNRNQ